MGTGFAERELGKQLSGFGTGLGESENWELTNRDEAVFVFDEEGLGTALRYPQSEAREFGIPIGSLSFFRQRQTPKTCIRKDVLSHCLATHNAGGGAFGHVSST